MKVFKEIATPSYNPYGLRICRPEFADMTLDEIRVAANLDTQAAPHGWEYGIFIRSTSTIHLFLRRHPLTL